MFIRFFLGDILLRSEFHATSLHVVLEHFLMASVLVLDAITRSYTDKPLPDNGNALITQLRTHDKMQAVPLR